MKDCFEILGDIVAVHLLKPGELSFSVPVNVLSSSERRNDVVYNGHSLSIDRIKSMRGIAIDTYYNIIPSGSIIIEKGVNVKEKYKGSLRGINYDTDISAKTYDDINAVKRLVNEISECSYFDTLVVDSSERVFLIRGSEPSTRINVSVGLPATSTHSIEIQVSSLNGIIPVDMS